MPNQTMHQPNQSRGFTLLELMIAVAIIGIIAAVAIPSYIDYTRKVHYSELVKATGPYTVGVSECYQTIGTLTGCSGGKNGVPNNITEPTSGIASLVVTDGIIRVVPVAKNGLTVEDDYILTPIIMNNLVTWTSSGGGVDKGYAKKR